MLSCQFILSSLSDVTFRMYFQVVKGPQLNVSLLRGKYLSLSLLELLRCHELIVAFVIDVEILSPIFALGKNRFWWRSNNLKHESQLPVL